VCEKNTPLPPKHGWREELEKGGPPTLHYDGGDDYELQKVAENPSAYTLILEGHHDHLDCNAFDEGDENKAEAASSAIIPAFEEEKKAAAASEEVKQGQVNPIAQSDILLSYY